MPTRRSKGNPRPTMPPASLSPEWSATSGGTPLAAASAATNPKLSGKMEGTTAASRCRQELRQVPMFQRPDKLHGVRQACRIPQQIFGDGKVF